MKKIMTIIAILATLTLTGCSLNNELSPFIPVEAAGNSETSTVSEVEEPTNSTSEVENDTFINTSKPVESTTSSTESKPEEKPVESTSSTVEKPVASTSTTVEKPISSSTSSKVEVPVSSSTSKVEKPASSSTTSSKPVSSSSSTIDSKLVSSSTTSKPSTPVSSSSTTTTSVSTSKPVEKVHNCSTDGHVWEVTITTTEPKWCREMHVVTDFGLELDMASKYLGVNAGEAYKIFKNTCKENGVSGASGNASIDVEVWGTETFETKACKFCNHSEVQVGKGTINPMGEWQYVNGVNPMLSATNDYNFNTLFYDPYNAPQVVIDNIRIINGL